MINTEFKPNLLNIIDKLKLKIAIKRIQNFNSSDELINELKKINK